MKNIHYTGSKHVPKEGIYRFRIYSYDAVNQNVTPFAHAKSAHHLQYLKDTKTDAVPVPTEAFTAWGPHGVEKESEVSQGSPEYQMFKLDLLPLAIFTDLIEATRDRETDIWIEVVLEQPVLDAEVQPGRFCAPRKHRMHFWGKLNRAETNGKVRRQKHLEKGPSATRTVDALWHLGSLSLTFVHWLKVRCEEPVKPFLDSFRATYTDADEDVQVSAVLYHLLKRISPTPLFACADWRLDDLAGGIGGAVTDEHRGACNFLLSYKPVDSEDVEVEMFDDLWVAIRFSNAYRTLFYYSETETSPNSLYSCKDLGELLVKLTGEFFLFPQVEIPTLEEALANYEFVNSHGSRLRNWMGVSRWLFIEPDKPAIKIYIDPIEDTWEYNPAATWASQYKVEMPTTKDLQPVPAYSISKGFDGGSEKGYKTLFRFIGQIYVNNVLVDSPIGVELFVNGNQPFGTEIQHKKYIKKVRKDGVEYTSWAAFHADRQMNIWGSVRSTLSVRSRSHALEPFGANDKRLEAYNERVPEQHFKRGDFGDFPLLREYVAGIGLMAGTTQKQYRYVTYSVTRDSGSPTEIKMMEIAPIDTIIAGIARIEDGPVPPPPPGNPEDPPTPSIPTPNENETVSAVEQVTVTYAGTSEVAQVSLYINGLLHDTKVTSTTSNFVFDWDTLAHADGPALLKAVATDIYGNEGSVNRNVLIDNIP